MTTKSAQVPPRQPWSLLAQASALTIVVMLFSTLSYGLWYESRIAAINRQAAEAQAVTLATTLATAAEQAVISRDAGALESLLINMRSAPHLNQLAVFGTDGKPRAVVDVDARQQPRLNFELGPQQVPTQAEVLLQVGGGEDDGSIIVWAPIKVGVLAGWTRTTFDRKGEGEARATVRQQTIMSALLTATLTVLALFLFLRSRLKPVAQCAGFARDLGTRFGHTLEVAARSREVSVLQGALNATSRQLEQQYREIAERNERLDAIFSLSPDGLVVFDHNHCLAYANPSFAQLSSLTVNKGLAIGAFETMLAAQCEPGHFTRIDDAPSDRATDLALIRPVRRLLRREHRFNDSGHLVLYFRDVTAEADVANMKSEFLSTAAHELRTPMVSVFGFVELLLNRKYPEEAQRSMLEVIHRQSRLLINMVNELLDLARIEARAGKDFTFTVQPLRPLLEDTCAALSIPATHSLNLQLPSSSELAEFDGAKLRQALSNVLSNAIKYSPGGGEVRVSCHVRKSDAGSSIGIRVEDQGIGMTPEQCSHAFERFFRADTSGNIPGTGLGLSLVKEIVDIHGGSVELQSEAGKGTCLTLWLPRVEASADAVAEAA